MCGEINEPVPSEETRGAEFANGTEEQPGGARPDPLEAMLVAQVAAARQVLAAYRELRDRGTGVPRAYRPANNVVPINRRPWRDLQRRPRASEPGA